MTDWATEMRMALESHCDHHRKHDEECPECGRRTMHALRQFLADEPKPVPTSAQADPELTDWLFGVLENRPVGAGAFVHRLAEAAACADWENYPLLRPVLLQMKAKYPRYSKSAP
jgi:hypothetical protein